VEDAGKKRFVRIRRGRDPLVESLAGYIRPGSFGTKQQKKVELAEELALRESPARQGVVAAKYES
jgi:hypothetical protein